MIDRASLDMVEEFHRTYGQLISKRPTIWDPQLNELRLALLHEELAELAVALYSRDRVGVLDALTDLQYVLDGAYLSLGFADMKQAALIEVHRSNMSKLGADGQPILRHDGKVLKGPNYSEPDLEGVYRTWQDQNLDVLLKEEIG